MRQILLYTHLFLSLSPPPSILLSSLSTSSAPYLWRSVDDVGIEDQLSSQSPSSDLVAEIQSTPGQVDGEQQQGQELEDGPSSLEQEGNTSDHQHHEQQVSSFTVSSQKHYRITVIVCLISGGKISMGCILPQLALQTNNHSHSHLQHRSFWEHRHLCLCTLEEIGPPGENPCRHMENMKTQHRKAPEQLLLKNTNSSRGIISGNVTLMGLLVSPAVHQTAKHPHNCWLN